MNQRVVKKETIGRVKSTKGLSHFPWPKRRKIRTIETMYRLFAMYTKADKYRLGPHLYQLILLLSFSLDKCLTIARIQITVYESLNVGERAAVQSDKQTVFVHLYLTVVTGTLHFGPIHDKALGKNIFEVRGASLHKR